MSAAGVEQRVARTKLISWQDPAALAAVGAELCGREFLEAIVDRRLPPRPIARLIGAELVSVGDGEALFRCTPDESTYNPIGMVHGGLLCTLLDSAAGCAVHTRLPAGAGYGTIEIKVSFLEPLHADAGEIEVCASDAVVAPGSCPGVIPGPRAQARDHRIGHPWGSTRVPPGRDRQPRRSCSIASPTRRPIGVFPKEERRTVSAIHRLREID